MLGAVEVVPNDGITALVDISDCCGKKVKVGSSVCKFIPAGERLMIQHHTVVAIATQTLYILPIGSSNAQ